MAEQNGDINVVWHNNSTGFTDIYLAESKDGGKSFDKPVNLSSNQSSSFLTTAAMDRNGSLYVAWADDGPANLDIFVCKAK